MTESPKDPGVTEPSRSMAEMTELTSILDNSLSVFLMAVQGRSPLSALPFEAFTQYANGLRESYLGEVDDPLLAMLVDQFVIGHFTAMRLHSEAAGVMDTQVRQVNHSLATKLSTELRRLYRVIDEQKTAKLAARGSYSVLKNDTPENELPSKRRSA